MKIFRSRNWGTVRKQRAELLYTKWGIRPWFDDYKKNSGRLPKTMEDLGNYVIPYLEENERRILEDMLDPLLKSPEEIERIVEEINSFYTPNVEIKKDSE